MSNILIHFSAAKQHSSKLLNLTLSLKET